MSSAPHPYPTLTCCSPPATSTQPHRTLLSNSFKLLFGRRRGAENIWSKWWVWARAWDLGTEVRALTLAGRWVGWWSAWQMQAGLRCARGRPRGEAWRGLTVWAFSPETKRLGTRSMELGVRLNGWQTGSRDWDVVGIDLMLIHNSRSFIAAVTFWLSCLTVCERRLDWIEGYIWFYYLKHIDTFHKLWWDSRKWIYSALFSFTQTKLPYFIYIIDYAGRSCMSGGRWKRRWKFVLLVLFEYNLLQPQYMHAYLVSIYTTMIIHLILSLVIFIHMVMQTIAFLKLCRQQYISQYGSCLFLPVWHCTAFNKSSLERVRLLIPVICKEWLGRMGCRSLPSSKIKLLFLPLEADIPLCPTITPKYPS
jgi:hypothetical protein